MLETKFSISCLDWIFLGCIVEFSVILFRTQSSVHLLTILLDDSIAIKTVSSNRITVGKLSFKQKYVAVLAED